VVFDSSDRIATLKKEGAGEGEGVSFAAGAAAASGLYESPYAKVSPGTYE